MRTRNQRTDRKTRGLAAALRGRYWRAAEAGQVLTAWRASGQSLSSFADQHGLSRARLARWRERLSGEHSAVPVFHPVQVVVEQESQAPEPAAPLELVVQGGRRIRIASGFDAACLAELVRVVEGWRC